MQTKFNVGDIVFYFKDLTIKKAEIYSFTINDNGIYCDICNDKGYMRGSLKESRCFATFEEARQQLVKDKTKKYQDDMEKILALKEGEN